jgi:hypothetical protein
MRITVKAEWLRACGYNAEGNRTFKVVFTYPGRLPDGTRMFDIDFNGRVWTVAEWRCEQVMED